MIERGKNKTQYLKKKEEKIDIRTSKSHLVDLPQDSRTHGRTAALEKGLPRCGKYSVWWKEARPQLYLDAWVVWSEGRAKEFFAS